MAEAVIGKITHVFDRIGVGVIELTRALNVGDRLKIKGHDREFEQEVTSMQIDRAPVQTAKKGQSIGLKFDGQIKEGDVVYKM